jgi:hypothetical protein
MDIDVLSRNVRELLDFRQKLEQLMSSPDGKVDRASATLDELVAFKGVAEKALPDVGKAVQDVAQLAADIQALRAELGPVLEWIAAKQKQEADGTAMAAEAEKQAAAANTPGDISLPQPDTPAPLTAQQQVST